MKLGQLLLLSIAFLLSASAQQAQYIGAGGCASSNCHGATSPAPESQSRILGNEYSLWSVRDKHSQAYSVLTNDRSKRMAQILGLGAAESAQRCLDCHAVGSTAKFVSDGVACEACHGPAEKWLGPHTAEDSSHANNVSLGMYDTKDLKLRAQKCLSCHIGDGTKKVDHELIAAGHPDLVFELDTFSAALPMHWRDPKPEPGNSSPRLRALAVGQAMALADGMRQLAAHTKSGWPEFAEFECYQCHHDLRRDSWRIQRGYAGRKPGGLLINVSRFVIVGVIASQTGGGQGLDGSMANLTSAASGQLGNGAAIAGAANQIAQQADALAARFGSHDFTSASASAIAGRLEADIGRIAGHGVGSAEQATMAIDAIAAAFPGNLPAVQQGIQKLYDYLEHPSTYRPAEFAAQFKAVASQLH